MQSAGASRKNIASVDEDDSSSDSSDEDDSSRPLNYKTPLLTQVTLVAKFLHIQDSFTSFVAKPHYLTQTTLVTKFLHIQDSFTSFVFFLQQGIGRLFRCLCNPAFDVDDEEIVFRGR